MFVQFWEDAVCSCALLIVTRRIPWTVGFERAANQASVLEPPRYFSQVWRWEVEDLRFWPNSMQFLTLTQQSNHIWKLRRKMKKGHREVVGSNDILDHCFHQLFLTKSKDKKCVKAIFLCVKNPSFVDNLTIFRQPTVWWTWSSP